MSPTPAARTGPQAATRSSGRDLGGRGGGVGGVPAPALLRRDRRGARWLRVVAGRTPWPLGDRRRGRVHARRSRPRPAPRLVRLELTSHRRLSRRAVSPNVGVWTDEPDDEREVEPDASTEEPWERPIDKFRRGAAGSVIAAGLLGVRDALEGRPEKEEPAIVADAPSPSSTTSTSCSTSSTPSARGRSSTCRRRSTTTVTPIG